MSTDGGFTLLYFEIVKLKFLFLERRAEILCNSL